MITYRPGQPPSDPAALPGFLREEFAKLQQAARQAQPYAVLQTLNAAPAKTFEGMVVLCDGTNLDLGSGAGVYCYYASSWKKLG